MASKMVYLLIFTKNEKLLHVMPCLKQSALNENFFSTPNSQDSGKIMAEKSPTKFFGNSTHNTHIHTHMVNNQISEPFRINGI